MGAAGFPYVPMQETLKSSLKSVVRNENNSAVFLTHNTQHPFQPCFCLIKFVFAISVEGQLVSISAKLF